MVFDDDFSAGLAGWDVRPLGGRPAGDGVAITGPDGLAVVPTATNPQTGEPAFAEPPDPGGPDLRWAALVDHTSSAGFPGFDAGAGAGAELAVEAELSARGYGQPSDGDGAALIALDRESGLVFDMVVTPEQVLAVYERLGVFSYAVPVADRSPDDWHRARIAYEPAAGTVRWWLDGRQVLEHDRLGRRLYGAGPVHDSGAASDPAAPRQLVAGLGLLARKVHGQGVRLAARRLTVTRG